MKKICRGVRNHQLKISMLRSVALIEEFFNTNLKKHKDWPKVSSTNPTISWIQLSIQLSCTDSAVAPK